MICSIRIGCALQGAFTVATHQKNYFNSDNTIKDWGSYPAISRIKEMTQNTYWYGLCLDFTQFIMYPGGAFFWLIHPNWGRTRSTNPRRKPERNPPIWAKLSTFGRIPTAKFIQMMTMRVSNAANCTQNFKPWDIWYIHIANCEEKLLLLYVPYLHRWSNL